MKNKLLLGSFFLISFGVMFGMLNHGNGLEGVVLLDPSLLENKLQIKFECNDPSESRFFPSLLETVNLYIYEKNKIKKFHSKIVEDHGQKLEWDNEKCDLNFNDNSGEVKISQRFDNLIFTGTFYEVLRSNTIARQSVMIADIPPTVTNEAQNMTPAHFRGKIRQLLNLANLDLQRRKNNNHCFKNKKYSLAIVGVESDGTVRVFRVRGAQAFLENKNYSASDESDGDASQEDESIDSAKSSMSDSDSSVENDTAYEDLNKKDDKPVEISSFDKRRIMYQMLAIGTGFGFLCMIVAWYKAKNRSLTF